MALFLISGLRSFQFMVVGKKRGRLFILAISNRHVDNYHYFVNHIGYYQQEGQTCQSETSE